MKHVLIVPAISLIASPGVEASAMRSEGSGAYVAVTAKKNTAKKKKSRGKKSGRGKRTLQLSKYFRMGYDDGFIDGRGDRDG